MTLESQSLELSPTPTSLIVGGVFVFVVIVLALLAWQRSGWKASTGWLEALRVLVALVLELHRLGGFLFVLEQN